MAALINRHKQAVTADPVKVLTLGIKSIFVRNTTISGNLFSISGDTRYPTDIYGPGSSGIPTGPRPIGGVDNLHAGGDGQPGSFNNVPTFPGTNYPLPGGVDFAGM